MCRIKGPDGLPFRDSEMSAPPSTQIGKQPAAPARPTYRNFWRTATGAQASNVANAHDSDDADVTFTIGDGDSEEYAAGSAVQAARRGKESFQ